MTNLINLITPINLEEEKIKFFASNKYNPIFRYQWQSTPIKVEFQNPIKQLLWTAIKDQNTRDITINAASLFDVQLNSTVLKQATIEAIYKGKIYSGNAAELAEQFGEALQYFDVDYRIKIVDKPGFNVRPKHKAKTILISSHAHFEYFSIEAEVKHEMVHVIRAENSLSNNLSHSADYLPTEEGLASWCQDQATNDGSLAQHAMEYVASSVGITDTLRAVYDCFCELGASPDLAWKRASRHKFGFVDTSQPGDIMKPAMYYYNELRIGRLNPDERLRLFVGKIGLRDLQDHPSYRGRWQAAMISTYFKL